MLYDRFFHHVSDGTMLPEFDREVSQILTPRHGEICKYVNTDWDGAESYVTSDGERHDSLEDALTHARCHLPGRNAPVTGGQRGFAAAVEAAYNSPGCADPIVRYAHQRGFYVVSQAANPRKSYELIGRKAEQVQDAATGKSRRSLRASDYAEIRDKITGN